MDAAEVPRTSDDRNKKDEDSFRIRLRDLRGRYDQLATTR
jgi:hypothetical protein